jgi:hypothetical protein
MVFTYLCLQASELNDISNFVANNFILFSHWKIGGRLIFNLYGISPPSPILTEKQVTPIPQHSQRVLVIPISQRSQRVLVIPISQRSQRVLVIPVSQRSQRVLFIPIS